MSKVLTCHINNLIDDYIKKEPEYKYILENISKRTGLSKEHMRMKVYYYLEHPNEQCDISDVFDPVHEFRDSFYYEEYDPSKKYETEYSVSMYSIRHKVSIAESMYIYNKSLCTHFFIAVENLYKKYYKIYVVVDEIFSMEDIRLLGSYCRCDVCKMSFFNPFKYTSCRECNGCITTIREGTIVKNSTILRETRRYLNECIKLNPC